MNLEVSQPGFDVSFEEGVLFLEFASPETRNAIAPQAASALGKLGRGGLAKLVSQNGVGVVALRSSLPKVFLSGGDLNALSRLAHADPDGVAQRMTVDMRDFCRALREIPVPSVTLLHGAAVGGGAEVALATDFRWAVGTGARLDLRQASWGVPGGWNGMVRLGEITGWDARRVGLAFALQETWTHAELERWHLLDQTVEPASYVSDLKRLAARFLQCDPSLAGSLLGRPQEESRRCRLDFDEGLFRATWMQEGHKNRLERWASDQRTKQAHKTESS